MAPSSSSLADVCLGIGVLGGGAPGRTKEDDILRIFLDGMRADVTKGSFWGVRSVICASTFNSTKQNSQNLAMNTSKTLLLATAITSLFAASATSQRLATYDPASAREFATSACAPAPTVMGTRNLAARTPAMLIRSGAIAADNVHRILFTTTGFPADGIDAVAFLNIGTGSIPNNYAAPPGFNQITGMVVDPLDLTGSSLIVTDGYSLAAYDYAGGAYLQAPQPIPLPAGRTATGLDFDVWTNDLVVVLNDATIMRVPISSGPWTTQPPAVGVPPLATGIAVCRNVPGAPMVSFFDGTVMDPQTGATQPFPGGGILGPRRHRGMTFYARPVLLGGKGLAMSPEVEILGSYQAGSNNCIVDVTSAAPTLLVVDIAPMMNALPGLAMIDGTLLVNPATSITMMFMPGRYQMPLDLSNVPDGAKVVVQAAALGNGTLHMSDAQFFQTWK